MQDNRVDEHTPKETLKTYHEFQDQHSKRNALARRRMEQNGSRDTGQKDKAIL